MQPEGPAPHAAARRFTRAEVQARNSTGSAAIIIDNLVYDVTEFLEEHPGGAEVLLDNAGRDASDRFHEVGHSELAIDWREQFLVGELVPEERRPLRARAPPPALEREPLTPAALLAVWGPPAALAALAALVYVCLF